MEIYYEIQGSEENFSEAYFLDLAEKALKGNEKITPTNTMFYKGEVMKMVEPQIDPNKLVIVVYSEGKEQIKKKIEEENKGLIKLIKRNQNGNK
jgi:hypothetical protein